MMLVIIASSVLLVDRPNPAEGSVADPEALFAEARRHRRQRRLRIALLVLAGLAAGGGFYGAFGGGSSHLPTVPQIEAAVAARLARSHDLVLHETVVRSPGGAVSFTNVGAPVVGVNADLWTDLRTGDETSISFNAAGRRTLSSATTFTRDARQPNVASLSTTFVYYGSRTWFRQLFHEPLAGIRRRSPGNPFVGDLKFRLLGRDTVDGQQAFHLRADYPQRPVVNPKVKLDLPTAMDVWISTADSRVLLEQTDSGTKSIATTDFRWLPRTSANLAELELSVPSDFTYEAQWTILRLPSKPPTRLTPPLRKGSDLGVSVVVGTNGVVVFDATHANGLARKTFDGRNASYTCFRVTTSGDLTTVASGERHGAFAGQAAFQLKTRGPFDGCELSTGYGRSWPDKFGGHDPVEIAFTPAGTRYFADRAAARDLAQFVRSRRVHEIRREPPPEIAGALAAAYKHGVTRVTGQAPASPGEIGYAITGAGVTFSDRSTTGRMFSVQVEYGKITRQNVKPLGYVF